MIAAVSVAVVGAAATAPAIQPTTRGLPACLEGPTESRCPSWASEYDYPGGRAYVGQQKARAIVVSPDGTRAFVTGSIIDDDTLVDYGTVAYDTATGALLWAARHDGPTEWSDRAYSIALSPDGSRVFVTGAESRKVGNTEVGDFATVAYTATTGAEEWVARYDAGGHDRAAKVVADGSRLYVTGSSQGSSGAGEYATASYDQATGREVWVARYADPAAFGATPTGLATSPDGSRVFVTGSEVLDADGESSAFATVAYDAASGSPEWVARSTGPGGGRDQASAVAVDATRVFVTGGSPGAGGDSDYATVAYDAGTGDELWGSRYDAALRSDVPAALAVGPGGVYVTGSSLDAPSDGIEATVSPFRTDALTVAYDAASGEQAWEQRFASSAHHTKETGVAIALSPDGGRVVVGGYTMPASGGEPTNPTTFGGCSSSKGDEGSIAGSDRMGSFLTISYGASTGAQEWYATFNASTDNHAAVESGEASALAISPDGTRVYVAGTSAHLYSDSCPGAEPIQNYTDYWTLAYPTGAI